MTIRELGFTYSAASDGSADFHEKGRNCDRLSSFSRKT